MNRLFITYIYGKDTREFDINHYISVLSNVRENDIDILDIYTNHRTRWKRSEYGSKLLKVLNTEDEILGHKLGKKVQVNVIHTRPLLNRLTTEWRIKFDISENTMYPAHQSDLARIGIMYYYTHTYYSDNIIYSDVDSIAVGSLWDQKDKTTSVPGLHFYTEYGSKGFESVCNGFFYYMGYDRESYTSGKSFIVHALLADWLINWRSYSKDKCKPKTPSWTKYSVQMLGKLMKKYDGCSGLTLSRDSQLIEPFYLSYKDTEDLFFLDRTDKLSGKLQVHLWETRNRDILKVLSESYFRQSNATYAQLGNIYL